MRSSSNIPLVTTVKERCRMCFTCVRECPAKAIRILDGQAEVMPERCIGCGNCVRVCSQHAKQVRDCTANAKALLAGHLPVVACVAPSFPAEFSEYDYTQFVGMLRALGFHYVHEVAFGADLVAARYRNLLEEHKDERFIATSCPAVIAFVERYHPDLVPKLAPIVSPMVAAARVVNALYGPNARIVFIGPCIAKKGEMLSAFLPREIHATLAFTELRRMFDEYGIRPEKVEGSDFDPPHGGTGSLFPIRGGLLQAANMHEDLMAGKVVTADGRSSFVEAIREFESQDLDVALLEVLACQGCISGPGIDNDAPLFRRRSWVSRHARRRAAEIDQAQWLRDMERFSSLDLSREFGADDQRVSAPSDDEVVQILAKMGKFSREDELNCGACGYESCREHAIAIFKGLAESEMCLPYLIEQLKRTVQDLAVSNKELARTQQALMQSEKLASMGQLAAGIAHEINNPLGAVLMYSHMLRRDFNENPRLGADLTTIAEQADRCKKIVAGLLHFARQNKVQLQSADLCNLVQASLKTIQVPKNITVELSHHMKDPIADLDCDQIAQVLGNLISNACAAMPDGGTLRIETGEDAGMVEFRISDTGTGIPKENIAKVFEPFFTTKQIGKGTGLGLSITYGIIKMHGGNIRVTSNTDSREGPTGTTFSVTIPRHGNQFTARESAV